MIIYNKYIVSAYIHVRIVYKKVRIPNFLIGNVTDENYQEDYREFVCQCIGHVIGMRHFRQYIKGTTGELLYAFYLDVEKWLRIPDAEMRRKWTAFREMQLLYFKNADLIGFSGALLTDAFTG